MLSWVGLVIAAPVFDDLKRLSSRLFDASQTDLFWLLERINSVWLAPHFVLFKYINNQKQLINFPSDASQQLLMSEEEKFRLPPPLLLPTPFLSCLHFRHTLCTRLIFSICLFLQSLSDFFMFSLFYPSPSWPSSSHSLHQTQFNGDSHSIG